MIHPLYDAVTALMRQVGEEVLLHHFRNLTANDIREKTPGDPVTIADEESERRLSAALTSLISDAAIVGEEAVAADPSVIDRIGYSIAWIIDPIDGTANYAAGKSPFGILVALAEAGEAVAGWLYDPVTGRMCHAVRGGGAFVNGERVHAVTTGELPPVAAVSTLFMAASVRQSFLDRATGHYRLVDIPRCAAEQYPRLVLGANDISLFERTLPWDHAAGILFLNEAGGKAARPDGSAYRVTDTGTGLLAAASLELWDEARELLY